MRGAGHATCHHGEILQGAFRDGEGRPCLGLVTLPMTGLGSSAEFTRGNGRLTVFPEDRVKALRAAELTVQECADEPCGGHLRLHGDIPVGLGMGSSTSDVIAAVRAVAASFGRTLPPETIARLAVRAERASDPLMLTHRPLLFAQREGRVLEVLGRALPAAVVVGCVTGNGRPVQTLAVPADSYGDDDLDAYERMRRQLRVAVLCGDVGLLGRVCTESARRHQRLLAKPELDVLVDIAARAGAAGVQVAHSGNVAGLLFDPSTPDLRRRLARCTRALNAAGTPVTRIFTTREDSHVRPRRGGDRPAGPGAARRRARLPSL